MTSAELYARLSAAGLPVLRTSEAAALLGISPVHAAQALRRLAKTGLIRFLRHGLVWTSRAPIDPWVALEYVASPYPAYASLYSALSIHGVLSQLPAVRYAVTLGRAHQVTTKAGVFSLHRIAPALFGGFETLPSGAKIASVEKALFDLAYLAATRTRLFARPPELDLPKRLDRAELRQWVARIAEPTRRSRVRNHLSLLLSR